MAFLFPELEFKEMAEAATKQTVGERTKSLGAYYTDSQVADFLVWWAIRKSTEKVLDPSFGGGVFLRSAAKRLREMGGEPKTGVYGVELDRGVHAEISGLLHREFGIVASHLPMADFFDLSPGGVPRVDAVVGNPPFIRYQRFCGEMREKALARASEVGLQLSGLTSSWLPFLVHSMRFLRPGGRLAMVIPFELGHAAYARPMLGHLADRFETVTFLTFRKKLFPDLSEDTLLLLADGYRQAGPGMGKFQLRDLAHAGDLAAIQVSGQIPAHGMRKLASARIASGQERLIESLIAPKARDLYRRLAEDSRMRRLAELADVGIGYVTGSNSFFHLTEKEAARRAITRNFLRPCVRRGRSLAGLRFTAQDWARLSTGNDGGYLLQLPAHGTLPEAVIAYLDQGKSEGVHLAFKCRTRDPWFRVPHVYQPDAFLTYMSGDVPRLVANDAGVVAPNSLHIVRVHRGVPLSGNALAALWQTALTQMSVEIEGHALGGGLLKLEPTEAGRVLLPFVASSEGMETLAVELDQIARERGVQAASHYADERLLQEAAGLTTAEIRLLRTAGETLRDRRNSRGGAE